MLRYWRVLLLVIMVAGSLAAIGLRPGGTGQGVEIAFVADDSPAQGILRPGMVITSVNGAEIRDRADWAAATGEVSGPVALTADGQAYEFGVNDSLGITVIPVESTNLEFGLDLKGGTRILLQASENATAEDIEQVLATMETRANIFGLKEIKFQPVAAPTGLLVQVESSGIEADFIENFLATQGKFEAKVIKPVALDEDQGILTLGEEEIPVSLLAEGSLRIGEQTVQANESVVVDGIRLEYAGQTARQILLWATVYDSDDIELVYTDPQSSTIIRQGGGYVFFFTVQLSVDGAQRFADVTTGIPAIIDIRTGERQLDSRLLLFLDGELVEELTISADLGGAVHQTPRIQGFRTELEEAEQEMSRLQTVLRSGALPVTLEVVSSSVISPTLGEDFLWAAAQAGGLAALFVFGIVFARYRSIRIAVPVVLTVLAEITILLGVAAANDAAIWIVVLMTNVGVISWVWWKKHEVDIFAWGGAVLIPLIGMISWTIDLPAIGGIIAAIGTGVDHQIIIADETLAKRAEGAELGIRKKLRKAFFIIFGAAATTIAAMLPLFSLGVGLVRGFAITTIAGVLIGILVTRPAYAKMIEAVKKG